MPAMRGLDLAGRVGFVAVPAALTVYLAVNAGGYHASTFAFAAFLVALLLVLRTTAAVDPLEGFGPLAGAGSVALAGLLGWTLLSATWSDSLDRAFLESQRVLLYLLTFVLFASVAQRPSNLRWMGRLLAVGLAFVCGMALLSRVLPEVFEVSIDYQPDRLAFPVTYWNSLGLIGAIGGVLCLWLSSDAREHAAVRCVAAAAIPMLAATVYFTLSRGAILVGIGGFVLFVLLSRSPGTFAALVAAVPGTAVAVKYAYDANLLNTDNPASPAAVEQGERVAVAVGLCMLSAGVVRGILAWLGRRPLPSGVSPRAVQMAGRAAVVAGCLVLLAGALAIEAPARISNAVDGFLTKNPVDYRGDQRARLTDPTSNGRIQHWEVSKDSFEREPLRGTGAGTYQLEWVRDRDIDLRVTEAHSLVAEVAGELGVVGVLLVLGVLGTILVGLGRGIRGPDRLLYAGLTAAAVVWIVRSCADWDWEMPATGLWLFAIGGAAVARRPRDPAISAETAADAEPGAAGVARGSGPRWAVPLAVAWLVVAVAPLLLALSDLDLRRSAGALQAGDCAQARDTALASIDRLSLRAQPYEILGYCNARAGYTRLGVQAMERAVERDPGSWETHFGLGVARGAANLDPLPELRLAQRLNPREALVSASIRVFEEAPRGEWSRVAIRALGYAEVSGQLTIYLL